MSKLAQHFFAGSCLLMLPLLLRLASVQADAELGTWMDGDTREPVKDAGLDLKSGRVCVMRIDEADGDAFYRIAMKPRKLPADLEEKYLSVCLNAKENYDQYGTCMTPEMAVIFEDRVRTLEDFQLGNCPACMYNVKEAACQAVSHRESGSMRVLETESANEKGYEKIKEMRIAFTHRDAQVLVNSCKDVKQLGGVSAFQVICQAYGFDCEGDPEGSAKSLAKSSYFPCKIDMVFTDTYEDTTDSGDDAGYGPIRAVKMKLIPCEAESQWKCDCDNCRAACEGGGGSSGNGSGDGAQLAPGMAPVPDGGGLDSSVNL